VAVALATALATDTSLATLFGARLLDARPLASVLHWRAEAHGPHPIPLTVGITAATLLLLLLVAGYAQRRRMAAASRQLRTLDRSAHTKELVVVRSAAPIALAIPPTRTAPGRIVVSDGMLRELDPAERRVLLAHERSHLHHHHDRYRRLARLAGTVNPLLLPTVFAVDFLLERWADEDAAHAVGSRQLTARALARAALAGRADQRRAEHASFATHQVSRRVHALLTANPARWSGALVLFLGGLALLAVLAAALGMHDLAHLFDLLRGDG
jgi:Zn-dependent protease with chaperone function